MAAKRSTFEEIKCTKLLCPQIEGSENFVHNGPYPSTNGDKFIGYTGSSNTLTVADPYELSEMVIVVGLGSNSVDVTLNVTSLGSFPEDAAIKFYMQVVDGDGSKTADLIEGTNTNIINTTTKHVLTPAAAPDAIFRTFFAIRRSNDLDIY